MHGFHLQGLLKAEGEEGKDVSCSGILCWRAADAAVAIDAAKAASAAVAVDAGVENDAAIACDAAVAANRC